MMKNIYLTIALLIANTLLFGQITDKNVYPEPSAPSLPAAGGKITDPTFGTTILRVTDANDGNDNTNAYSYWPAFNKDNSLLYVFNVSGQPKIYDFDPVSFTISNKRNAFTSNAPDGAPSREDAIWSSVNPDVMICHTAQKLYEYNVKTNTYNLLHNFGADFNDVYLWQMSRSHGDSVFAFTRKENLNYTEKGYVVWSKGLGLKTFNVSTIDEVQVDKTGQYIVYKTGNQGQGQIEVQIIDLKNNTTEDLTDNGPDFSPGHSDNGTGVVVGADNWNNQITFRNLSSPHSFNSVLKLLNDWNLGFHVSMHSNDENWFTISFFDVTNANDRLFKNEIVLVSTDGNESIKRLCHTHSIYNNDYYNTPRACISPDGKFITFTSTWGTTNRRDVFIVKVPDPVTTNIASINKTSFELFPNPATNVLSINNVFPNDQITIVNVLGEIVLTQTTSAENINLNIANIPNGMYTIQVRSNAGVSCKMFVKE